LNDPIERFAVADPIAVIDGIFAQNPLLMPQPLELPFEHARDVIVAIAPCVGLALVESAAKPLSITTALEVINPLDFERPRSRVPIEIRIFDAAVAPPPRPLPVIFDRRRVDQVVAIVVADGADIAADLQEQIQDAVGVIGAALPVQRSAAMLILAGGDRQHVAREFPANPASLRPFVSRAIGGRPSLEALLNAGRELVRVAKDFRNARLRIVFVGPDLWQSNNPEMSIRSLTSARIVVHAFITGDNGAVSQIAICTGGLSNTLGNVRNAVKAPDFVTLPQRQRGRV
jgi:hypothetical protein